MPALNTNKTAIKSLESETENAIKLLKGEDSVEIQGQNPKINNYYAIWKGSPDWQKYNVHFPNGETKLESYKTLNAGRYICRTWASSYMNEDTEISINEEKSNNRLQEIFEDNGFKGKLNNFVESFMGLGIGAISVLPDNFYINEDNEYEAGEGKVKIRFIGGRRVIPITVDDGEFIEVAFACYKTNGVKLIIYWLNEKGEYVITELLGTGKNGNYTFNYQNRKDLNTHTNIPLFQVWTPNVTEEDDVDNVIGTSVLDKAVDALFQCDVAYNALFKEIKLGQKVKMISADLSKVDENGNKEIPYDINDESVIELPTGLDGQSIMQEFNGALRTDQIKAIVDYHLNAACMLCGLGQDVISLSSSGGGRPLQTATQVVVKQNELYKNILKQENYATSKFKQLVKAIAFVNNNLLTGTEKITDESLKEIKVKFDDNIMEDDETKRKNDLQDLNSGVLLPEEYRARWTEESEDIALKKLQETGELATRYMAALQAGAMDPEFYCQRVYGNLDQLEYIKSKLETPEEDGFGPEGNPFKRTSNDDETDDETKKEEEKPEEETKKDDA